MKKGKPSATAAERRHFFGIAHTKLTRLPDDKAGQVYELRLAGADNRHLATYHYYSAEHIATLQPTVHKDMPPRLHQDRRELYFLSAIVESNEPIAEALYEDVTGYCLSQSAGHTNLFLPPAEMLDAVFFRRLSSVLTGNNDLRMVRLWLLENWLDKRFADMTWEERYKAIPVNVKREWKFASFKKWATDAGMPSRRFSGPKPRQVSG